MGSASSVGKMNGSAEFQPSVSMGWVSDMVEKEKVLRRCARVLPVGNAWEVPVNVLGNILPDIENILKRKGWLLLWGFALLRRREAKNVQHAAGHSSATRYQHGDRD